MRLGREVKSVRHLLRGLDEMALETAFISVSALVGIVILAYAFNSSWAAALGRIPFVGAVIRGGQALTGQIVHR